MYRPRSCANLECVKMSLKDGRIVAKFDQFFESLYNKIGEDSSKFDTIIQTERFDIISY